MIKDESARNKPQRRPTPAQDTGRSISCVICNAIFEPSQSNEAFSQASLVALESALMGMSHFCFCCRRPACPDCWDDMHGVCGACAQDAHLPFRKPSSSLAGTLFSPTRRDQGARLEPVSADLVCVHHGKFWGLAGDIDRLPTRPARRQVKSTQDLHRQRGVTAWTETQPERAEHERIAEQETRPERRTEAGQIIRRIVMIVLSVAFALVLLLLALALALPNLNAFIVTVFHINVQLEVEQLLRLIKQLHF